MSLIKANNIPKFDGASFYVWKHRVLLFSIIKKLEGIVEGTKIHPSIPPPTFSQQPIYTPTTRIGSKEEWDSLDAEVLCIIETSFNNNQEAKISKFTLNSKSWNELLKLFEFDDHAIQTYLKDRLAMLYLKASGSLT